MGLLMNYVIEPPVGALNTAPNTGLTNMSGSSKILLELSLRMMSIDMGGPFNKAAYVFELHPLQPVTMISWQQL